MSAAPRQDLMPIDQVADMLASRIDQLARELLPAGRQSGAEWQDASTRQGGIGNSLSVRISGGRAGTWRHFGGTESGDALDLVAFVLFRGDKKEALKWSARWLGLNQADPHAMAVARRQAEEMTETRRAAEAHETEQLRRLAHRRWLEGQERIAGTPVEAYLAGRGIDLASLGRQPAAIRFHPALYCEEVRAQLPAMVTAISGPAGFMACHRTWLEQAGPGDWRKARLDLPKKVLGRFSGGIISLWRGETNRALPAAMPGEIVDVTEGIEDGLSVAMACPESRVVAAVSLSNMGGIHLPPAIVGVRIWRQNDTKRAAIAAADRVVQQLLARGLQVLVPEIPANVKDVNEWLTSVAAA